MPEITLLEQNLKKCDELDPMVKDIAKDAVKAAFAKNMTFIISETKRTYHRQCLLLSQGRTRSDIMKNSFKGGFKLSAQQMKDMMKIYDEKKNLKGDIVTHTLDSEHVKGIAMDIYPQNTSYAELAMFFNKWNIKQPFMWDKPHFSLAHARPLDKTQEGMLTRLLGRLRNRLGV